MDKKPNNFAAALNSKPANTPEAEPVITRPVSPHDRPARRGTKHVGGYFDPAVSRQLRMMAAEEDSSLQDLLAEALDMLFHERQKPTIARRPVEHAEANV